MMKSIGLLILLIIAGCAQHPKEGDWYEHKGTGEKIKIQSVGQGRDLDYAFSKVVSDQKKMSKKLKFLLEPVYHYDSADSLSNCIMIQQEKRVSGPYHYWQFDIISVDRFLQDYKLIE